MNQILSFKKVYGENQLVNEVFESQLNHNTVYRDFVQQLKGMGFKPPFLPVEAFKHYNLNQQKEADLVFMSSGTTQARRSKHAVYDAELYRRVTRHHFEAQYGAISDWTILALLPSYVENGDSSLVYMVDCFIELAHPDSSFVLHQPEELNNQLQQLKAQKRKTMLIGVSYALLDFAEEHHIDFPELIIMETGGMKGRREELIRATLHRRINRGFPNSEIHSEYGMTELLSQAYSSDGKWFHPPEWMLAYATDVSDPLTILPKGSRGLLAFIDLANYYSCSFIQTKDIGMVNQNGSFTIEGRMDNSDLRGCNLLYT
ncbi:MAG: acyl transferase [Salibacteraceae bacterium]